MEKKDGGPAFPFHKGPDTHLHYGMSLRDYFAAAALTGMCANADISLAMAKAEMHPCDIRASFAESAFKQSDEMLKAREQ